MKATTLFTFERWLLARGTGPSLCPADHFLIFLINPKRSMIFIRRRISWRNSAAETFLGKLGNKGLDCMENPCKRAAYILSNRRTRFNIIYNFIDPY
jgi:hypothetical protein